MISALFLPLYEAVLETLKVPAQLPSSFLFEMQSSNDHRLHLPVSIFAESGKAYANDAVIFGDLRDEVRITVLRPFIENEDWRARGSGFSDDGAHRNLRRSMQ